MHYNLQSQFKIEKSHLDLFPKIIQPVVVIIVTALFFFLNKANKFSWAGHFLKSLAIDRCGKKIWPQRFVRWIQALLLYD